MKLEKTSKLQSSLTKCTTALWNQHHSGKTPVIPDIKCMSPGEGDLLRGRDPVEIGKSLAAAGAPVLSVVTEAEHFRGSPELLGRIAQTVSIPILRKDFISTREQLVETAAIGASGVLLIAAMLEKEKLFKLIEEALALELEPLVEIHNQAEIIAANELALTFVGINNRNIVEWEMDDGNVATTEKLIGLLRPERSIQTESSIRPGGLLRPGGFILSESSISSPQDVLRATAAGAHGVLVGTAILRARDPVEMYYKLSEPGR